MKQRTPLGSELKQVCHRCGLAVELYGSTCKHLMLCVNCGKSMAVTGSKCHQCATPITRLIREYNVRSSSNSHTDYFIGRFVKGLPDFKEEDENKWFSQKGPQGQQFLFSLLEEYKNKSLLLEEKTSHLQYIGVPDGSESGYYILVLEWEELFVVPVGLCKVAPCKQVTLKEAGEKMRNRAADFKGRWMKKVLDREAAASGRRWRKSTIMDDKKAKVSDREEEDHDGPRGVDLEDYNMEMGIDDWEHDNIDIDPNKQEDLVIGTRAPAAIKLYDDEYETGQEEGEGLTESGKEMKKLLKRVRLDDSDEDIEDYTFLKREASKEDQVDNSSPLKQTTFAAGRLTPIFKSPKTTKTSINKPGTKHMYKCTCEERH